MTPIEAARHTQFGTDPNPADEFLLNASSREIQEFIRHLHYSNFTVWSQRARVALDIRLAEDAAESAEKLTAQTDRLVEHTEALVLIAKEQKELAAKLERQTNKLIFLSLVLVVFSVALLAVALVQTKVMFKENTQAHVQAEQTSQNYQLPSTNK
jgi:hypothetical protein